jgi:hypothetical protein
VSAALESLLDAERRRQCKRNDQVLQASVRTFTRAARMVTTSTGITIGIAHQPKPQAMGTHAENLQAALLDPRTARPLTPVKRLLGALWRWL